MKFGIFRWRTTLALLSLTLLAACILVDDFGPAWEKSVADPCISKIAEGLYYTEFRREPDDKKMDQLAHAFTLEDQHFLLLKQAPDDKGGRLYRFAVTPGTPSPIFTRFRLNPVMRESFEKNYPNAPVTFAHDTVRIATLDANTKQLLLEIARQPDYWEVEEKALYNAFHNPRCPFEPTDLPTDKKSTPGKHHDKK